MYSIYLLKLSRENADSNRDETKNIKISNDRVFGKEITNAQLTFNKSLVQEKFGLKLKVILKLSQVGERYSNRKHKRN
jgi:hypothetical protein